VNYRVVDGDLLDQEADAIVNSWNRNVIPWWLLLPQGVSGAIKRRGGLEPFRELARMGPIPLGAAVVTSAGRLPYAAIIHVAGINLLWRASKRSIQGSVRSAMALAAERGFQRIAMPIVGAGSGGFNQALALTLIEETLRALDVQVKATVVRYVAG
jgi:O-acetyl-ADP-ribose deacetylase